MAPSGDEVLGPQYNDQDDFTLTFEHLVLTIIPASLFILCCPWIIFRRLRNKREPETRGSALLLVLRLIPAIVLFIVDTMSIGFWTAVPADGFRPGPALASATLCCVADLLVATLVFVEYRHCLRTSAALSLYISIGVILDGVKTRSYFLRPHLPGMVTIGALCAASAAAKLSLAMLEEVPKRSHLGKNHLRNTVGGESLSGFWSRSLFIWLNSTFFLGFRSLLDVRDLENLGPDLDADRLYAQFRQVWDKTDKTSRFCLTKSCLAAFWESFFLIPIPRLLFIGFSFAQPFLLHRILVAIREDQNTSSAVQNGLIAATILIFFGSAVTNASFTHLSYRFIARLRSVLVQQIYNKTLVIPQAEAERNAAVTLMSTEIDSMILGLAQFHDVWAAFVEIAVGTWLLSTIVGKICYLIIPIAIVSTAAAYELGQRMGPARMAWSAYIQVRVAKTANVLSQIKVFKMLGLSSTLSNYIQEFRVQELIFTRMFRKLTAIMVGTTLFLGPLTPIIIMAGALFWTTFDRHLDANEVFPMLAVLNLVEGPLGNILMYYPNVMSTMACVRRIQDYLILEEIRGIPSVELARASKHSAAVEKAPGVVEIGQRRLRAPLPTTEQHVVQFFMASIAPERGKPAVLFDVNINIEQGSLAMVTSSTGGGKSTLLRSVTGGAEVSQGSMHVDPRIAYCAQDPWIPNDTICKIIIGWCTFERVWYDTVVKACLLVEDIASFPGGDQFLAGSRGVKLSGGQKQRLAMARAVYSQSPVVVFDDVFAPLDSHTAASIFCAFFGANGLLRKTNTTVIMATSRTAEFLDLATDVISIHEDGKVVAQANSNRPDLSDAALFGLLTQFDEDENKSAAVHQPESLKTLADESRSEANEEKEALRQSVGKGLYRFYLNSVGWVRVLLSVVFTGLAIFTENLLPIYIRIWIHVNPDNMRLFIPFALIGVMSGTIAGFNLFYYWFYFVPKSAEGLHKMLADVVMRARLSFLTSTESGNILNRFSQDMNLLTQELPVTFWKCVYSLFLVIINVCVLIAGVSYAAAAIPLLIAVLYTVQTFYLRTSRQLRYLDLESKAPLYTHFTETADGLEHIRCFGWEANAAARNVELLEYSQKPFYTMYAIQRWLTLVMDMTCLVLAVAVVTLVVKVTSVTTPAGFGLAFLNFLGLSTAMTAFIERWTELETSLGTIARLKLFLKMTPVEKSESECESVPKDWPQHGHIVMKHMSASYLDTDDNHVLRDISLDFQPGKKAAVVGRTGSGKSTLITTILNFLDYAGSIQIDGIELSSVAPNTLRSRVTTITQDRIKLDSSVRDNIIPEEICLSKEKRTTDSLVFEALDQVGLSDRFTGQLDAPMTDIGLSAGQQQQFNIARAIIHRQRMNSKVVLMDEPTSSLGSDEDAAMQAVMARVFSDCTVITVTHRQEAVQNRQIVVELENGRIVGYEG